MYRKIHCRHDKILHPIKYIQKKSFQTIQDSLSFEICTEKIFPDKTNDLLFNVATNQPSEEDDGVQEGQSTNNEFQEEVDFTQHVGNNDEYGEDEN